ncbi:MAG: DUF3043 domain-containing protein [Nocardiopsaceae bacterium]|nr:DUF3043 domain-containing protein [Nocardiopsaceae bacterium]
MFRRRSAAASPAAEADQAEQAEQAAKPVGKGRPTPKRSEVERRRRQPYTPPPANKKAAAAQQRERRRADQRRRMDAMRKGEEWALSPRDRGPVKALARDYIDSRRLVISEYILFGVFALILLVFAFGAAKNSSIVLYLELAIVLLIVIEASFHATMVRRLVRQRMPGESTKGLTWYIIKRSIRLRSSRIPPARVARGEAI